MHHMKWVSGRQQQWLRIILGAALSALPALAYGLGLGRLVVESGLDEPLRAHVRVIDVTPAEIKTLSPKLASDTYFQAAGISRHSFLSHPVLCQPAQGRQLLHRPVDCRAVQ